MSSKSYFSTIRDTITKLASGMRELSQLGEADSEFQPEEELQELHFSAKTSRFDDKALRQFQLLQSTVPDNCHIFANVRLNDFLVLDDPSKHLEHAILLDRNRVPFVICDSNTRPVAVVRFCTEAEEHEWSEKVGPILSSLGLNTISFKPGQDEQAYADAIRGAIEKELNSMVSADED